MHEMHAKLDHLEQVEELCAGGGTGTLEKSECQRMKKNAVEQQQLFEALPINRSTFISFAAP